MIEIRNAILSDTEALTRLLLEAGYPDTTEFLHARLAQLLLQSKADVLVAVGEGEILDLLHIETSSELTRPIDRCNIRLLLITESTAFPQAVKDALLNAGEAFADSRNCDGLSRSPRAVG
jgi:hypothetical protein